MRLGHWHQAYRIHRQQVTADTLAMSSATARTPRRSSSNAYAPNSALEDSATCAEQIQKLIMYYYCTKTPTCYAYMARACSEAA